MTCSVVCLLRGIAVLYAATVAAAAGFGVGVAPIALFWSCSLLARVVFLPRRLVGFRSGSEVGWIVLGMTKAKGCHGVLPWIFAIWSAKEPGAKAVQDNREAFPNSYGLPPHSWPSCGWKLGPQKVRTARDQSAGEHEAIDAETSDSRPSMSQ